MRVIDGAGEFGGLFHVLCPAWSPLHEVGPDQLRLRQLLARPDGVRDVTYGTAPDVEGDTAALHVAKLARSSGMRLTRLTQGIGVGTEIEFAGRVSLLGPFGGRLML